MKRLLKSIMIWISGFSTGGILGCAIGMIAMAYLNLKAKEEKAEQDEKKKAEIMKKIAMRATSYNAYGPRLVTPRYQKDI